MLGKSTWAVLGLTCNIELFTQAHYRSSIEPDANLSAAERDRAVDDLIALVGAVDGLLQLQAGSDADYFVKVCGRRFTPQQQERLRAGMLKAYRWQYIVSGVEDPRFQDVLGSMITPEQSARIGNALAPILA